MKATRRIVSTRFRITNFQHYQVSFLLGLISALLSSNVHADCVSARSKATQTFSRCLSNIQAQQFRNATGSAVAKGVSRCEKSLSHSFSASERSFGITACASTENKSEAKARVFYELNQQARSAGSAKILSPTPGSDVLAWIYPSWLETGTEIVQTTQGLQDPNGSLSTTLKTNGYEPMVGIALPIIGWHANAKDAPNCPYTSTETNYFSQIKTLKSMPGINTIIGIANIGMTDKSGWENVQASDITACLEKFEPYVSGLMIDDEYNQLSANQVDTMLNWCIAKFSSSGRCGLVLGHGTMKVLTTVPATSRQDICMEYDGSSPASCDPQNPNFSRNLFTTSSLVKGTSLPFSIYIP